LSNDNFIYFKGGNMAIGIQGIDEDKFQELFDGDEEVFKDVLTSFVEKTPVVIKGLATVTKETLPDYAINVHGIKGACATVCAEEARKMAFNLETMSKKGDLSGVLAENPHFFKYIDELLERFQNWLKNH